MAFNGAHDFTIGTSNINVYQNHQTPSPAEILRQAQAVEALHTSATVGYISKCHPGTREKVTKDIVDWVVGAAGADGSSTPRKFILWFSGPAGGGKTSIMRGVVDRCGARGFSTLSFFFSVRGSGVTSMRPFVATIVHQLVALNPVLEPIVYNAIQRRPTIFEESLEFQMERLLVEPLQSPAFQLQPSPRKIVITIDGLDECREEREREHLIDLLHSLTTQPPYLIIVVIASRPEFDLRRAFDDPKLNGVAKFIKLHEYDGSKDIRAFVCDKLHLIRQSHPLRRLIPEDWQLERFVQLLVDKSSGNFIVPVTAMKYVKHSRQNPVDSLNIIVGLLKNPSPTSKPFAELDALYAHILHPPDTDLSLMKRILHTTIAVTKLREGRYLTPYFFDDLLQLPPGTTATTLCDLHSILDIPESISEPIKFHHKSLEDYLLDRERSLEFFQSPYETHLDLATRCTTHLRRWASNPVFNLSDYLVYSADHWQGHLEVCIARKPVSAPLLKTIMELDPRNSAIYYFIHGRGSYSLQVERAHKFHVALCSKHCVRLCQLITRLTSCVAKCGAFGKDFFPGNFERRVNAISRFKSETGLFAPLDPNSRVVFDGKGDPSVISASRLMSGGSGNVLPLASGQMSSSSSSNTAGGGGSLRAGTLRGFASVSTDFRLDGGLLERPSRPVIANLPGSSVRQPVISPWTFSSLSSSSSSSNHPPAGGSGGSARFSAQTASSMEVHDVAVVSKKRRYEGVETVPKKRRQGNGDPSPWM